jgi:hypothetical protein
LKFFSKDRSVERRRPPDAEFQPVRISLSHERRPSRRIVNPGLGQFEPGFCDNVYTGEADQEPECAGLGDPGLARDIEKASARVSSIIVAV